MLLVAACGGGEEPGIGSSLATQLAARSDSAATLLESREFCAARERAAANQAQTIAAINSGSVPAELQEELLASVNSLVEAISCTPPDAEDGTAKDARELAEWLRDRAD